MKSIKQQYIDLREGNMSQANFMRNLRMTLPQYVTNLSSFEDSVRILKNKGILTEADIKENDGSSAAQRYAEKALDSGLTIDNSGQELATKLYDLMVLDMGEERAKHTMKHDKDFKQEFLTNLRTLSNELKSGEEEEIMEGSMQEEELWRAAFDTAIDRDMNLSPENKELISRALDHVNPYTNYRDMNPAEAASEFVEDVLYSQEVDNEYDPGPGEDENFERDYDVDYEEPNYPFDMAESLREAKDPSSEGKWKTVTGKDLYAQFREIDNLNGQEVLIGIDYEMQCNSELTKTAAAKIVIKNLKKNPIYYTASLMAGKEGYEPEYIGGKSANAEARQMQPLEKNLGNIVDKAMGMKPVKDVEKVKKDSDKGGEANKAVKGITLMSLIAKSVRGLKKMDATGEKMKKVAMKEARLNDFPGEKPGSIAQQIMNYIDSNPTLKQYSDEITLQSNPDGFLKFGYWEALPSDAAKALSLQFNIEPDSIEADEDTRGGIFYKLTPKHTKSGIRPGVDMGSVKESAEDKLAEQISQYIKEITGAYGGDQMSAEDGSSYINKEQ